MFSARISNFLVFVRMYNINNAIITSYTNENVQSQQILCWVTFIF